MGFFTKKKEEKDNNSAMPNFPSEFPKYESEVGKDDTSMIKEAINTEVPIRQTINPQVGTSFDNNSHSLSETFKREKTLFVKVDRYKGIMKTLDQIKDKLEESQKILSKLNDLKVEEDHELDNWHKDLEELKEKLLDIDSTLFEQ